MALDVRQSSQSIQTKRGAPSRGEERGMEPSPKRLRTGESDVTPPAPAEQPAPSAAPDQQINETVGEAEPAAAAPADDGGQSAKSQLRPRRDIAVLANKKEEEKRLEDEQRAREVADRDRCLTQLVRLWPRKSAGCYSPSNEACGLTRIRPCNAGGVRRADLHGDYERRRAAAHDVVRSTAEA